MNLRPALLPCINAPFFSSGRLAQLVRATGLHPVGHRFESCAVHHFIVSHPSLINYPTTNMRHIISILVENKFGVLARIAGMFSGRGFNIETLNVGPMMDGTRSRITATIIGDSGALDQAIKQLGKLINVIEVTEFTSAQAVERELVMVKVQAAANKRSEIVQICDIFRAKIIDVGNDSMNVEMTGNANKVTAFLNLIQPYGIEELARTGSVALKRG
jgi:acetolactate synthase-1/3 small subunit